MSFRGPLLLFLTACGEGVAVAEDPPGTPVAEPARDVDPGPGQVVDLGPGAGFDVDLGPEAGFDAAVVDGQPPLPPDQAEAYGARRPKSVVEDQPYRRATTRAFSLPDGRSGTATLVDLAPGIGVWYVLSLEWSTRETSTWHLENPPGTRQALRLDETFPAGIRLDGTADGCDLWGANPGALDLAAASGRVYAPLCGGALALRNPASGHRTTLEWTADMLRDHVYGGERIANTVKQTLFVDAQRVTAELGGMATTRPVGGPAPAEVSEESRGRLLDAASLALPVDGRAGGQLTVGAWYPVHGVPGAWAGVIEPRSVAQAIIDRNGAAVAPLDPLEATALVYTAAFDLAAFDLGYEVGTDHPRVGWSDRVLPDVHDATLPGPDGFDTVAPLARTGILDPVYLPREVAVFVGGFKRDHGAFAHGELARQNGGSHYGFVEYGTELSRLQPGLATLVVWADQSVELRTWTEADNARLWQVRHARQNGVPVLETDPATGLGRPGAWVRDWARGNWSGSVSGEQRSVRGGLCIQDSPAGRYLLYSYFSSATPSAMADVFAAYGCSYAMLLDMNALEHTYMAVHRVEDGQFTVHQLVSGMEVLDQEKNGDLYARFVGYADNRDFFYLLRRP